MITAKFGNEKFFVERNKIYTPKGISISEAIELEETEVAGKKPKTSVKAIKLQTLSFEALLDARFVNVESKVRWWKSTLLSKQAQWLQIGAYKVGYFYLSQLDTTEMIFNDTGALVKAKLALSFTENGSYATDNTTNFVGSVVSYGSKFRIGSTVKPKSGTRRYSTAEDALSKKGASSLNSTDYHWINGIHKDQKAVLISNGSIRGWVRIEDLTIIVY